MRNSVLLTLTVVSALVFSVAMVTPTADAGVYRPDSGEFALSTGIDDIVLDGPDVESPEARTAEGDPEG